MADDIRTYVSANNTDDISSNAIRTYVVVLKMSECRSKDLYVQILHNTCRWLIN